MEAWDQDMAYLHSNANLSGLTVTDDIEYRFGESVGKLVNDGMPDGEARQLAFKMVFGHDK